MDVKAFLDTLPLMAKGMGCIFAVTAVIILTIVLLNKLTAGREPDGDGTDNAQRP